MERGSAGAVLNRRQFVQGVGVAGLGLLAGCGRLPWQGQHTVPMSRIGVLSLDANEPANETFRLGLRALGHVDGQNVIVEWRFRRQSLDEYAELAAELVRLPVDAIVAQGTAAIRAAKNAS